MTLAHLGWGMRNVKAYFKVFGLGTGMKNQFQTLGIGKGEIASYFPENKF